jgi:hypothetical protein
MTGRCDTVTTAGPRRVRDNGAGGGTDQTAGNGAASRIGRQAADQGACSAADQGAAKLSILPCRLTARQRQGHSGHDKNLSHMNSPKLLH